MIHILIDYKWAILIVCELTAWLTTFYMLYARYWLKSNLQFYIFGAISLITGYFPHLFIGILNIVKFQKVDSFTIVIVILFILGITFGKKLVAKIDIGIQNYINKQREISS